MSFDDARQLIEYVGGVALRCRTGVLIIGDDDIGSAADIAARLGADYADWIDRMLRGSAPGARYLPRDWRRQAELLRELSDEEQTSGRIVVANLDFGLSGLAPEDGIRLWSYLRTDLVHSRSALILALPGRALARSLAAHEQEQWVREGRLASL